MSSGKGGNMLALDDDDRPRPSTTPAPTWDDHEHSGLDCCWQSSHLNNAIPFLRYLTLNAFWFRVLYALRLAFVGVLPVALLAYHQETKPNWIFPSIMITFCIVAAHASVSESIGAFVSLCRSLVFQLILVEMRSVARASWATGARCGVIVLVRSCNVITKMTLFHGPCLWFHWKRKSVADGRARGFMAECLASAFNLFVSLFRSVF